MWPFSTRAPANPICYRDDCMNSLSHPLGEHMLVDLTNYCPYPYGCRTVIPDEERLAEHLDNWHLAERLAHVNPAARS